jgi:putative RNA 2'-phosphotransferase
MKPELIKISKFLSLILRHKPESIGVSISPHGWVKIDELIKAAQKHRIDLTKKLIDEVITTNDKQRFTYSSDGESIRANQGHSVNIELELEPIKPPDILYHGTAVQFVKNIRKKGLLKMNRQHVHLSLLKKTAYDVGKRHGKPIILTIDAQRMTQNGYEFYLSKNGVWLTKHVPPQYLQEEQDVEK